MHSKKIALIIGGICVAWVSSAAADEELDSCLDETLAEEGAVELADTDLEVGDEASADPGCALDLYALECESACAEGCPEACIDPGHLG